MRRHFGRAGAGTVDVVIVGAGHSGLAMSHVLSGRGIEHVLLERGQIANSWHTERWDSLRLLTPNWMSRLPGFHYDGSDPDGYMHRDEVIGFVSAYAAYCAAPVLTNTRVTGIAQENDGYRVQADRGEWRCRAVVLASGAYNKALVPAVAQGVPGHVRQVTAREYRNPGALPDGGVLVVGASATGLQLADEIHRSGRPVTVAVGEHVRLPRLYRGRDIQSWMLATGLLDETLDDVDDPVRVRRLPSPQLAGTAERKTLDLNTLSASGVRLVGRLAGVRDGKAQFSGSLRNVCALADLKMNRLLRSIDDWAADRPGNDFDACSERFAATAVPRSPALAIDFNSGEIQTIVWATGFRPDYSWLAVPVVDRKGGLRHDGGVVDAPGLYALGLPFLRRRKSSFMHGAEDDVRALGRHLAGWLDRSTRPAMQVAR